jgi:hypothetical protein
VEAHEQSADRVELYVLGALNPRERREFELHLADCAACAAEVRAFVPVCAALALTAPPAEPSPHVRSALLERIRRSAPGRANWLALAATILLVVGLGGYALQLRRSVTLLETRLQETALRAAATERQIADVRRTALDAQSAMTVLTAPDLARIDLAGQPAAPSARARAFWSRSSGLVLTGSNLPAAPAGRIYQVWVLTNQPSPISAGLLKPDASGRVSATFATRSDIPTPVAVAVTLEPDGGVPSPTGDKYLVGLAQ